MQMAVFWVVAPCIFCRTSDIFVIALFSETSVFVLRVDLQT
jgi:hypothetical protein